MESDEGPAPYGSGVADPLEIHPSPHVTLSNLVVQTVRVLEIRLKKLTPRVSPFKVTQCHQNQHGSIGYL